MLHNGPDLLCIIKSHHVAGSFLRSCHFYELVFRLRMAWFLDFVHCPEL
jgi:hypothetical protein